MTKRITVSRSQVAAAKLKIKRSAATGSIVDPGTRAIAAARKISANGVSANGETPIEPSS